MNMHVISVTTNVVLMICLFLLMKLSDSLSSSVVFQTEAVTVDRKFSCRIYPSLPQTDRYEAGVPKGAAAHGLHNRSTDTQVGTYASVEDQIRRPPGNECVVCVTGNITE